MNLKIQFNIIVILFITKFCIAQRTILQFLDSIQNKGFSSIEIEKGAHTKAVTLFKQIDTTTFSKKQVDLIVAYYKYNVIKAEEYPFPLLRWSKKQQKN